MNTAILWNELKSSNPFLDLSKKIEIEYMMYPKLAIIILAHPRQLL